jgi:hypothetical protein
MSIPALLLVALSLSCTSTVLAVQDDLPAAKAGLAIPAFDAEDVSLGDLLADFTRVTGQHIVMTESTRTAMQQMPVVIGGTGDIPPDEVYPFVEGLLFFHGFFTAQLKGGSRPLLGVYSQREANLAPRKAVKEEDLGKYADHPAFLIQTVIELPYVDVRQLSTSMRGMLRDTNTQMLLAVGDHGVVLAGTGQFVTEAAKLIQETNEHSRAGWERRAKAQEGTQGNTPGGARKDD